MRNHALNLLLREAMPVVPILTQLVEEGVLLKIVPDIIEKFLLLMRGQVMWYDS